LRGKSEGLVTHVDCLAHQQGFRLTGSDLLNKWLLKVELNGEWEECAFKTRAEAMSAFAALVRDYTALIKRAVLYSPERELQWPGYSYRRASRKVH